MNPALTRQQLQLEGIPIELQRKRIKNLNLRVSGADGRVRVSAPLRISEREIHRFLVSRLDWIRRQRLRLTTLAPQTQDYVSGERHALFANELHLSVSEGSRPGVSRRGDVLRLSIRPGTDRSGRQAILQDWYREQLTLHIPVLIAHYEPLMQVQVAEWRIRKMKTRWGSCNIQKRRIWINLELARLPAECLEYIVVHEMTHLLERGHNARFYAFMDRFMPQWHQASDRLRGHILV